MTRDRGASGFLKSGFFELIVQNAPACIALLRGPDFRFEVVNPAYAAIAPGIPMAGKTVGEVFPQIKDAVIPLLKEVLRSGVPFRTEDHPLTFNMPPRAGAEIRYFSFSCTRIADGATPDTHSILVLAVETTARKKAEDESRNANLELKRQWRTFDTALSNSPDFIYTFNVEGRLTYANRALLTFWQMPLEDALGKNFFDLKYPEHLAAHLQAQIQYVADTGQRIRDEAPFTGPTGEVRYHEYIFVPVFTTGGLVEAVSGSTRDVTDRKLAEEEELARQEAQRESAKLESLGIMAGGIAHDFNNLLTGILGQASLLAETASTDYDRAIAGQIVFASERAAELTRQMLVFSGKGQFVVEAFDLDALIKHNIALFRATLLSSATLDLELRCGDCLIEGDRSQIQQVVMNLLINASEAIGKLPGRIRICTEPVRRLQPWLSDRLHSTVAAGEYIALEVADNGSGMSDQTLKRLFDPFFTTKFTGRGLGLAAVLGIVKGHRGDIEVESQVGMGTKFRVFLPLSNHKQLSQERYESKQLIEGAGRTVLVVDDEAIVLRTAKSALQSRGFRVAIATNGVEALEVLKTTPGISLVILDLTMPVMTGEQALPLIRKVNPSIPIVLSSGYSGAEVTGRFSALGIAGVLQKPYSMNGILSTVAEALEPVSKGDGTEQLI